VRRLLLFAALLSLVGLTTAFAASFSVQSEDIKSFSAPVSISVPTTTTSTAPTTTTAPPNTKKLVLYLNGAGLPGMLAEDPPVPRPNNVNDKQLSLGAGDVQEQTLSDRYHSWQTAPAPAGGVTYVGPATLRVFQNGPEGRVRAALFSCGPAATPTAVACTQIGLSVLSALPVDNVAVASFPAFTALIPATHTLRVQIMNPETSPQLKVQWGYKTNRESLLEISRVIP